MHPLFEGCILHIKWGYIFEYDHLIHINWRIRLLEIYELSPNILFLRIVIIRYFPIFLNNATRCRFHVYYTQEHNSAETEQEY